MARTGTTPLTTSPFAGETIATPGAVVSATTVTETDEVDDKPEVSTARASTTHSVPGLFSVASQTHSYGDSPTALTTSTPLTRNSTCCKPLSSSAVAASVTQPATVLPFAGEVMLTVGGVVSPTGRTVTQM